MNARSIVRPTMAPRVDKVAHGAARPVLSADRSFKVLQPSRAPAQLSLFPPPAEAQRQARGR